MRRVALAACLLACAEWRMKPTFPREAAGRPVLHEQALIGLSARGEAAVAQLIDADAVPPELSVFAVDPGRPGARPIAVASPEVKDRVARRLREGGRAPTPLLAALISAEWPEGVARARELGFAQAAPAAPEPGGRTWRIDGSPVAGSLPLALTLNGADDALVLLLGDRAGGPDVELARVPVPGATIAPTLWIHAGAAWLLAGSVGPDDPLHRAVGLRGALLSHGEAVLHNRHGLDDYAAGSIEAAAREFARSVACDGRYVDALYNSAAAAALVGRADDAVALLRRAAAVDPGRVQVLGRNDDDLKALRARPDVRAILGLHRPPREDVPPPP